MTNLTNAKRVSVLLTDKEYARFARTLLKRNLKASPLLRAYIKAWVSDKTSL